MSKPKTRPTLVIKEMKTRRFFQRIHLVFWWAVLIAMVWGLAITAGLMLVSPKAPSRIETPAQKVCPYCGSKKFPPFWSTRDGWVPDWTHLPGVYRCEDCDRIWGPWAEEWINAHPDPREWDILLPPEVRKTRKSNAFDD